MSATTTFQVLYTKQKTKKRKAWQDGRIEVDFKTGSCFLYSDGTKTTFCAPLDDPLLLTAKHIAQIKSGLDLELDFANYVATIEYSSDQAAKAEAPPPAKTLPKFKPPAVLTVAVADQEPEAPQHRQPRHAPLASNQGRLASGRGRYDVNNDELDEEWGCDEEPAANGGSGDDEEDEEQHAGHNYSPLSWGGAPRGLRAHSHEEPPTNDQLEPRQNGFAAWGQVDAWGQGELKDQSRGVENENNIPKAALWSIDWLTSSANQPKIQEPPAPTLLPALPAAQPAPAQRPRVEGQLSLEHGDASCAAAAAGAAVTTATVGARPSDAPAPASVRIPPMNHSEAPVPADDSMWGFF